MIILRPPEWHIQSKIYFTFGPDENCPWCLGLGVVDSGGYTPWDTAIEIPCGCIDEQE